MKPFLRYWLPVIALCGAIFLQSGFATPDVLPGWPFQDKVIHAGVYGVLGALWVRALNSLEFWQGRRWSLLATSVVLATLYGVSDEWHQSFVPARNAESMDVLADFIGSAVGTWIYLRMGVEFRAGGTRSRSRRTSKPR